MPLKYRLVIEWLGQNEKYIPLNYNFMHRRLTTFKVKFLITFANISLFYLSHVRINAMYTYIKVCDVCDTLTPLVCGHEGDITLCTTI